MTQIIMAHPYLSIAALIVIVDGVVTVVRDILRYDYLRRCNEK